MHVCYRSPSELVNNVSIVEVINHNQVFNFNQLEQVLSQTNQQQPQTSSESLINSPRPSRSTNPCSLETSIASPRQSNRHQIRNASIVEEQPVNGSRSHSHIESNDRTTDDDEIPSRSTDEIPNDGPRIKIRMAEPEEGRPRRRPKRHEVILPTANQEVTSNYEHLVLPTSMQSRPAPALSNLISTDITLLPTRPQVKFKHLFFKYWCYLLLLGLLNSYLLVVVEALVVK